jgi:hypothetical protein
MALVADIFLLDSKFENHIDTERQCIGDGLVTAGLTMYCRLGCTSIPGLTVHP